MSDKKWINFVIRESQNFSKCLRAKYLSIIINKYDRLIGMGWNGKPKGSINDDICYRYGLLPNSVKDEVCCIHSEINCLLNTPMEQRFGATIYVSGIPCQGCMLAILNSNLGRLVYYENTEGHKGDSTDWWRRYGIDMEVTKFTNEDL